MELFDLKGQVAIVTGSSRGIGRAIAERLAEHGAKVVISSRKQEACDAVAELINAKHGAGTALAVAANISNKAALQALVDQTMAVHGPSGRTIPWCFLGGGAGDTAVGMSTCASFQARGGYAIGTYGIKPGQAIPKPPNLKILP